MTTEQEPRTPAEPLILPEGAAARASVVVAAGFLVSAGLSAALGLLIGLVLGESSDTDALLAAYSVYLVFNLFGANLRVALVPILGSTSDEAAFRVRATEVIGRLSTIGLVVAGVVLVLSPLLGRLLVLGNEDAAAETAAGSLALLALGSYCQIAGAAQASALAAARRFTGSAVLYVLSAFVSVVMAGLLMPPIGAIGAALGVLCGAIFLLVGHTLLLRRHGLVALPHPRMALQRPTWSLGGDAAGGAGVPLAYQVMLTISLAALSGPVGTVTAYSYAYFAAALLSSVTAASIGFVTMPDLVADLERRPGQAARDYVLNVAPLGVLLYVPIAVAAGVFGRPVLDAILDGPLGVDTVELLWDLMRIFLVAVFVWVLLTPIPTVALSLHKFRESALVGIVAVPVLLGGVAVATTIGGPRAVAVTHSAVTILVTCAIAVIVFRGRAPLVVVQTAWRAAPAVALAAVFPLLALLPHDGVVASLALATLGVAAYFVLAVLLWPPARPVAALVVPRLSASAR